MTESHPLAPYFNTPEWHDERVGTLRGSDVTVIAKGNARDIRRLWRLKTGRKVACDGKKTLAQLMGTALEDLNWRYFSVQEDRSVWGQGSRLTHPKHEWMGLSVDGITTASDGREAYLECKSVSAFKDIKRLYNMNREDFYYLISYRQWEEKVILPLLVREYMAQCHHAMFVGGWEVAVLSAIIGNRLFTHEIKFDHWYWLDLMDLEQAFWSCVTEDREPDEAALRGIVI